MGISSSIASGVKSRQAADEQRKKQGIIDAQAAEDKAWFNKQYYSDITKRTDMQNMLRLLQENQQRNDTRSDAQAAILGATPEQRLASREINRKTYADAVAELASNASQLKDQYLANYQNQRGRYYAQRLGMQDQLAGILQNVSNKWSTAGDDAFGVGTKLFAGGIEDIVKNKG